MRNISFLPRLVLIALIIFLAGCRLEDNKPLNSGNHTKPVQDDPPLAPDGLELTFISHDQISISWNDNSENEAQFEIQRKEGSGGVFQLLTSLPANQTAYADTALIADTEYSYKVRASNNVGTSDYSNTLNVTTREEEIDPPVAPSGLEPTSVSHDQISIRWNDNSEDEAKFEIQRKEGSGGVFQHHTFLLANQTAYTDTALTANTEYSYKVRASNNVGTSDYSNTLNVTTREEEIDPPVAPFGLESTSVFHDQISMRWNDNNENEFQFEIQRKEGNGDFQHHTFLLANQTAYTDTQLTADTEYSYKVRASNNAGNSDYSNTLIVTTSEEEVDPPVAPQISGQLNFGDVIVGFPQQQSFSLTNQWTLPLTNLSITVNTVGPNSGIFSLTANSCASQIPPGSSCDFTILFDPPASQTQASESYQGKLIVEYLDLVAQTIETPVQGTGLKKPEAPSALDAISVFYDQISIRWNDNSEIETKFELQRKVGSGGVFRHHTFLFANRTSYIDTSVTADTEYSYKVRAINTAGTSEYSNTLVVTSSRMVEAPFDLELIFVSYDFISMKWKHESVDEVEFEIYRREGSGGNFELLRTMGDSARNIDDLDLNAETEYTYKIRAKNNIESSDFSNTLVVTTEVAPIPPPCNTQVLQPDPLRRPSVPAPYDGFVRDAWVDYLGRTVALVRVNTDPTVVRFNSDETIDQTFGNNGEFQISLTPEKNPYFTAITTGPDGKIVVVGSYRVTAYNGRLEPSDRVQIVVKITEDGQLDTSFYGATNELNNTYHINQLGVSIFIPNKYMGPWRTQWLDAPTDVAVHPDGSIYVAGNSHTDNFEGYLVSISPGGLKGEGGLIFGVPYALRYDYYLELTGHMSGVRTNSSNDYANSIAIDNNCNLIVTGRSDYIWWVGGVRGYSTRKKLYVMRILIGMKPEGYPRMESDPSFGPGENAIGMNAYNLSTIKTTDEEGYAIYQRIDGVYEIRGSVDGESAMFSVDEDGMSIERQ